MEPDQNHQPLLAWLLLFTGCVYVVPGFFDLFLGHHILEALPSFGAGSMMFAFAAYFFLPPHRRRAKRRLRISGISLALVAGALSLYNMYIIPTDWAKPFAISLGLVMLTVLGIALVFYLRHHQRSQRRNGACGFAPKTETCQNLATRYSDSSRRYLSHHALAALWAGVV